MEKEIAVETRSAANRLVESAFDALKALLEKISAIRPIEVRCQPRGYARHSQILARIDVYGHSHTLACTVKADASPHRLKACLDNLRNSAALLKIHATPVIIAPYLSPEAQALCKESHTSFLDLEGNARLTLGEFFIGIRSLPCRSLGLASAAHPPAAHVVGRHHLPDYPANRSGMALSA